MPSDVSELINTIKELKNTTDTLDSTVDSLITAINNMSSKITTPLDTDVVVDAFSTKFKFYDVANHNITAATNLQSLTQKSDNYWFTVDTDDDDVYYYDRNDTGMSGFEAFVTPSGLTAGFVAWDWENEVLYGMDDTLVKTWNSSGTETDSQTLTHSSWTAGQWAVKAIAHDDTNDQLYAVLWKASTSALVYVKVSPTTGAMTDDVSISNVFSTIVDAEIFEEKLFLLDTTNAIITVYRLGETTPYFVVDMPSVYKDAFSIDKTGKMWSWIDADTSLIVKRALSFVQRVSVEDMGRALYMTTASHTCSGASQQLIASDAYREAIIITNLDSDEIVYVGTAVASGYPIYPKNSICIEGFTGAINVIGANGTELRYMNLR